MRPGAGTEVTVLRRMVPAGVRLYHNRLLTVVSTLFGAGALLVGIFPGNTTPHPVVAMIAFVFSALTAIAVFRVTSAPFRFMSLAVGVLSLAALITGELGGNSPVVKSIGIGGTERWVVFPVILWLAFYGGYLLASGHHTPPDRHRPAAVDGSTGAQADPPCGGSSALSRYLARGYRPQS